MTCCICGGECRPKGEKGGSAVSWDDRNTAHTHRFQLAASLVCKGAGVTSSTTTSTGQGIVWVRVLKGVVSKTVDCMLVTDYQIWR